MTKKTASDKAADSKALSNNAIDYGVLNKSIGYLLRRAQLSAFKNFAKYFSEFDIKPAQFSALEVIASNPGLGQSRLAESLGMQRTNLVGMLDTFERRDLIERKPSSRDKRSHSLFLTAQGKALLQQLHKQLHLHEGDFTAGINEADMQCLYESLLKLKASD